ncbi:IMS domain-containing protein [Geminocystis sp. NIES-3709]|uniref:IMS domain-containing protein n=1 Tax=Geminocystis sp. NIES-3709 TaxID=1617448 RepID=UPI0005FC9D2A|nr:IMS domain-containing protein [Geminocystis sp. NIES-3709]BAQ66508.1 cell division protein ZipN/Ftn2/Arc6 [Geminocystis sp. NIES-3709]
MQISLDYYRILGVPLEADSELIEQAYNDRIIQLPHKGYTEYAINSRKKIIQLAYDVLSQEESRLEYESSFLPSSLETEELTGELEETVQSQNLLDTDLDILPEINIEIEENLFIGALIVLLDLGEYELILTLAQPYLNDRYSLNIFAEKEEEVNQVLQDLVLTIVLAYLELAREQWQEKEYEAASNSLKKAYDLLFKEDLFSDLRKEIKQDLGKLMPYEILELLTRENNSISERQKAIDLLKSMLKARGGIESHKIDDSGLNIDSFLRFIQQIRVYLSAEEQQNLFEEEAQRPSPAAGYLAAYAGIARGFTERKPEFIIRAKNSLISLTIHQDVYLEQSICALLLGQTAEAEFSLSQSREKGVISYIQEVSQESPDLLPGLCAYTEKWLQTEVFPQFKNLNGENPSLQNYFEDDRVQSYLETITNPPLKDDSSSPELELPMDNKNESSYSFTQFNALKEQTDYEEQIINENYGENVTPSSEIEVSGNELENQNVSLLVENEIVQNDEDLVGFDDFLSSEAEEDHSSSHSTTTTNLSPSVKDKEDEIPPEKISDSKKKNSKFFLIPLIVLLLLFGTIAVFASRILFNEEKNKLEISLSEPLIELPVKNLPPEDLIDKLDNSNALEIINQWLKAKATATGPEYNPGELTKILTEPMLSKWVGNSRDLRSRNAYRRYEHKVSIESAQVNPQNLTEGIITARVEEKSQYYRNGALVPSLSYQDNLLIKYDLIKENNQWLIKDVKIMKN